MSARQALVEGAKKATDASREQVYWYVGANDYWYEQLRRQPAALQELSSKVSKLSDVRLDSLRTTVSAIHRECRQHPAGATQSRARPSRRTRSTGRGHCAGLVQLGSRAGRLRFRVRHS